jgi:hypothetical protein
MLLALYLIWKLFIVGVLWRSLLFFAGWFGIYFLLLANVPDSHHTILIFDVACSWAAVIASGVCIMALLTTKTGD